MLVPCFEDHSSSHSLARTASSSPRTLQPSTMSQSTETKNSAGSVDADDVVLIASDGKEFIVNREVAKNQSGTIKRMLEGPIDEPLGKISFTTISSDVLELVCDFMKYKARYAVIQEGEEIPEFDIPLEMAVDVLVAADYLNC